MTDWTMLLILAIFGIIGYGLMVQVDKSIDRHTGAGNQYGQEKGKYEHAETGKPKRANPGMPFFLHFQR